MMAKVRKAARPAYLSRDQADIAIEVATAIAQREPLTSHQRHWVYGLLCKLASEALEYKPKHRKGENSDRDFFMAMDYMLSEQPQKVVAKRWRVSPATLGQVVKRMRVEVNKVLPDHDPVVWLRVVKAHRSAAEA